MGWLSLNLPFCFRITFKALHYLTLLSYIPALTSLFLYVYTENTLNMPLKIYSMKQSLMSAAKD